MYALAYQPALDGLRAICLLAVFGYHSGFDWVAGGYLGVSTFFTLSGFLITSLLLRDTSPGPFWARRLRRLLPASLLTLVVIGTTGALWLRADRLEDLGGELIATAFYLVNWRFVSAEYTYSLLFSDPSPVQHFWSLAIEAQLYLIFPVVVWAGLRIGGRRALAAIVCVGIAGSTAIGVWLGADPMLQDRVYFGTDTRAAELLMGAAVAIAWPALQRVPRRAWDVFGGLALILLFLAFSQLSLDTRLLYRGGFLGVAVLSACVVIACLTNGRLSHALAAKPMVALGRVSYGAYLFHWPIFLVISPTDWNPLALFTVRVGLSILLAALSYRFLEEPIRRARWLPAPRFAWAAALSTLLLTIAALVWQPYSLDRMGLARRADPSLTTLGETRISIFGDSTAFNLERGYWYWTATRPGVRVVGGTSPIGCGLLGAYLTERMRAEAGGVVEWHGFRDGVTRPSCAPVLDLIRHSIATGDPHLVVASFGLWEVKGTNYPFDGAFHRLGEPALDAEMDAALELFYDITTAGGAHIVWLNHGLFGTHASLKMSEAETESTRQRLLQLVEIWRSRHPEQIHVLDLGAHLETFRDGLFDESVRSDGFHFTVEASKELVRDWLGEQTLLYRPLND